MNETIRILVVDDEPDILDGTSRLLERKGWIVDKASTGDGALGAIWKSLPDLVLLDRDLPDMDGIEVCRRIKREYAHADTFVVLISGRYVESARQSEGLEAGADGYILRPIANRELAARVESFARILTLTRSVREQACEIDKHNTLLHQQTLAALNVMEDALAARDKAERANEALRRSEGMMQRIFDVLPIGLWFADKEGTLLRGNPSAVKIWGDEPKVSPSEYGVFKARRLPSGQEVVPDDWALVHTIREGATVIDELLEIDAFDGKKKIILNSTVPVLGLGDAIEGAIVVNQDITERVRRERQETLTMEVLAALNRGNDVGRLIGDILHLVKDHTGIEAAGIRLQEGDDFPYWETIGFSKDFVEGLWHLCVRSADGDLVRDPDGKPALRCMCGYVLRGRADPSKPYFTKGGSFWTGSTTELLASRPKADCVARGIERCNAQGYESVALIPLRSGLEVIGLLQLHDRRRGIFTPDTIEFFEGLSASMGIAVSHRQAAEALKESEARARALFDASPDAVLVIGSDGRYLDNPTAILRYGYSREEFLTMTPPDLAAPELRDATLERVARTMEAPTQFEWAHRQKDGRVIPVEINAGPFTLNGQVSVLSIARDITERKQAQEEQAKLEDQLRLAQKMEAIGRLAGGIAHDFNNLLSVILGYTDFALGDLGEHNPLREHLLEVKNAGQRAEALTRQLLAFSRRQVMQPVTLDLNEVVVGIEKMLGRILGEDINLTQILAPDLWLTVADPGQIEQVIMNLAINSRDAMPEGGKLTIETSNVELDEDYAGTHVTVKPGPYVQLTVTDTGCGMDEATRSQIFEPFFTTKGSGKGTGLGLSTVYGIVRQSGGLIWVYSEPGAGTTFKIQLPAEPGAVATLRGVSPSPECAGGGETILVVEDEEAVLKLVQRILGLAGYTVVAAANGAEALRAFQERKNDIHLVVTDVVMPEMSGRVLAERLGEMQPGIKVLYLSGYTENAIVHHGVLDSGTHFIGKPFNGADLTRKVREVLDTGTSIRSEQPR